MAVFEFPKAPAPPEKLKKLVEKRDALHAGIKKEQAKLAEAERRTDTHRKVLAGAAAMELAKQDEDFAAKLIAKLQTLLRPGDRKLFGFPPVEK